MTREIAQEVLDRVMRQPAFAASVAESPDVALAGLDLDAEETEALVHDAGLVSSEVQGFSGFRTPSLGLNILGMESETEDCWEDCPRLIGPETPPDWPPDWRPGMPGGPKKPKPPPKPPV